MPWLSTRKWRPSLRVVTAPLSTIGAKASASDTSASAPSLPRFGAATSLPGLLVAAESGACPKGAWACPWPSSSP